MLKQEDIPAVLEIYNWYIANSTATFETELLTMQEFSARVEQVTELYPWIVLEVDGCVKGYAYLSPFNPRSAYRWTCDLAIYLRHDVCGKGYGTRLMEAILDLAVKDGYTKMVSLVTGGNLASEALHTKMGFQKAGYLEKTGYKNNEWLGVTFFLKDLQDPGKSVEEPMNQKML